MDISEELTDILLAHFGRTFTTREPVQVKCVSKTWNQSVSRNSFITAKAREEDNTKDWYFPLRFRRLPGDMRPWMLWDLCTWSGLHHSSKEVHALPPLSSFRPSPPKHPHHVLPNARDRVRFGKQSCLLASSGGLLLLAEDVTVSFDDFRRKSWRSLVVCNPLTNAWRMLPQPDSADVGLSVWEFWAVQAHLLADESANSYKVILTLGMVRAMCVYSSASNSWKSWTFPGPIPWGSGALRGTAPFSPFTSVPSAILNGKLYYAELEINGNPKPVVLRGMRGDAEIRNRAHVSVFKVDYEARTWNPPTRYALRNYFPDDLQNPGRDYGFRGVSFAMQIVECMGGLYAVIPAMLAVVDRILPAAFLEEEDDSGEEFDDEGTFGNYENGEGQMMEGDITGDYECNTSHTLTLPVADELDEMRYFNSEWRDSAEQIALGAGLEPNLHLDEDDAPEGVGYSCLPLQFYVVPLQGAGAGAGQAVGQLVMELLPQARRSAEDLVLDCMLDVFNLYSLRLQHGAANGQGFRCLARGSVIWVSWSEYLLQYDVMSGQSKAQILPAELFSFQSSPSPPQPNVSYRPNFHMKP